LDAVILPWLQSTITAAYGGEAHRIINLIFEFIATDAYKTPLWMYQEKLNHAYLELRIPIFLVVSGFSAFIWMSTRSRTAGIAIRNYPQRLGFLLFWGLLPSLFAHAYLGTFSRFLADDYCSAAMANAKGVLDATIHWYMTWTGRFSASFLDSLVGLGGPRMTPFVTPIVVTTWFVLLTFTLYQFPLAVQKPTKVTISALLAAALLFSTLEFSPSVAQSLYWGQGMRSVVPPLILATICFGLLQYLRAKSRSSKSRYMWGLILGTITFIAGGFSETYVVVQTSLLAITVFAFAVSGSSDFKRNLLPLVVACLVGSLISLGVVFLAPGNSFRQADLPPTPGLWTTLEIAATSSLVFVESLLASWPRVISILGLFTLSALITNGFFSTGVSITVSERQIKHTFVWLPIVAIILIISCFSPAAYAMRMTPPERTLIIPSFILVCSISALGGVVGLFASHKKRYSPEVQGRSIWRVVALCILVLFVANTLVATNTTLQQRPVYAQFASDWDAEDIAIRAAESQGLDFVVIKPLRNWAGLHDIMPYKSFWINQCASQFYGIDVSTEASDGE
jgi:hypothetical protein